MHITVTNDMSPHFWVDITTCCSGDGCASVLRNDKQQTKTRPTIFVFVRLAQPSPAQRGQKATILLAAVGAVPQQHNSATAAQQHATRTLVSLRALLSAGTSVLGNCEAVTTALFHGKQAEYSETNTK